MVAALSAPILPAAPVTRTSIIVPPRTNSWVTACERLRLRTDAGRRPRVGVIVPSHGGDDGVAVDGVDTLEHLVDAEDRLLQQDGPSQGLHPRAGALHAQHELALEVVLGARDGGVRHVGLEVGEHVEDHAHGLFDRLLPRAEVHGREAGVGVERGVRVDRVGEAALLAHLLEQVRAPRSAEDRVDDEDGVAVRVAALGPGPAEADVILLGVLLGEPGEVTGLGHAEIRAPDHCARLGAEVPRREVAEVIVVHAAAGGDDDGRVHVVGVVVAAHGVEIERGQRLVVADDGPPERMLAEDDLGEVVVDELGRRILVHRHLFEHYLALLVEVHEGGARDHLDDDLERLVEVLVQESRVDQRVLLGGRRVGLGAHVVEDVGDLAAPSTCPSP